MLYDGEEVFAYVCMVGCILMMDEELSKEVVICIIVRCGTGVWEPCSISVTAACIQHVHAFGTSLGSAIFRLFSVLSARMGHLE